MAPDLALVLIVALLALLFGFDARAFADRLDTAFRFWRNRYTWRAAWRLSERR